MSLRRYRGCMSCVHFTTPGQRQQLREQSAVMLTSDEAARTHPVPVMTASKLHRLRVLAVSADPKIRETVASSRHAAPDLLDALAGDVDPGVRGCVARNELTSVDLLSALAADPDERVRGWVAVNPRTRSDVLEQLATDSSDTVRALVDWARSVADDATRIAVPIG